MGHHLFRGAIWIREDGMATKGFAGGEDGPRVFGEGRVGENPVCETG